MSALSDLIVSTQWLIPHQGTQNPAKFLGLNIVLLVDYVYMLLEVQGQENEHSTSASNVTKFLWEVLGSFF